MTAQDKNHDGQKEVVINGGMGATYGEMKIIGYDPKKKQWLKLLAMGTPQEVDLDGDGQKDLVAISTGTLPGYVWIYRWEKDHFEMADVAKATGDIYAYLHAKEEIVWIESGKWVAGKLADPHYYRYKDGTLLELSEPPSF